MDVAAPCTMIQNYASPKKTNQSDESIQALSFNKGGRRRKRFLLQALRSEKDTEKT